MQHLFYLNATLRLFLQWIQSHTGILQNYNKKIAIGKNNVPANYRRDNYQASISPWARYAFWSRGPGRAKK